MMATYEVVMRNTTTVPIMVYAISYEWAGDDGKPSSTCGASLGFTDPMIGAGEVKTIQPTLHQHGFSVTPVVDLVLLENGSYYGDNRCGSLSQYQSGLQDRRITYQVVLRRLQADGIEKTTTWLTQQLKRDLGPFLAPKRIQ
jgi:hypothetical protein